MKDCKEKNKILTAPPKWFFKLLSDPIKFAHRYYQKKYDLKYAHAKKLFVFDIFLLLLTILLFVSTIYWHSYKPRGNYLVDLNISQFSSEIQPKSKILSGEEIEYQISYINNENFELENAHLILQFPDGFVFDSAIPKESYDQTKNSFNLNTIKPGEKADLSVSGIFYGEPNKHYKTSAKLTYTYNQNQTSGIKTTSLITIPRNSVLETHIDINQKIVNGGLTKLDLVIKNNNKHILKNIEIPLKQQKGIEITNLKPNQGYILNNSWFLDELKPGNSAYLNTQLSADLQDTENSISLEFIPIISINNHRFSQTKNQKNLEVLDPQLQIISTWKNQVANPGKFANLEITLKNQGNIPFENLNINIPLSAENREIINSTQNIKLTNTENAKLQQLKPGESKTINIIIPIREKISNIVNPKLVLNPIISSKLESLDDQILEIKSTTDQIKISSNLQILAEARYYTNEGDQLGRGPLPPQTGKQTKYWLMIDIKNTTNHLNSLNFKADLPEYIQFSGKTSVSHGDNLIYDQVNNQIRWNIKSITPEQNIGLYMELGFTPTIDQKGSIVDLLENVTISAMDGFTGYLLVDSVENVDSSLKTDQKAQEKGTTTE